MQLFPPFIPPAARPNPRKTATSESPAMALSVNTKPTLTASAALALLSHSKSNVPNTPSTISATCFYSTSGMECPLHRDGDTYMYTTHGPSLQPEFHPPRICSGTHEQRMKEYFGGLVEHPSNSIAEQPFPSDLPINNPPVDQQAIHDNMAHIGSPIQSPPLPEGSASAFPNVSLNPTQMMQEETTPALKKKRIKARIAALALRLVKTKTVRRELEKTASGNNTASTTVVHVHH